jgi:hypothetical protein
MVLRTNPERKRPGPTVLSINERFMPLSSISIIVDGERASREELLVLSAALTDEFAPPAQEVMAKAA